MKKIHKLFRMIAFIFSGNDNETNQPNNPIVPFPILQPLKEETNIETTEDMNDNQVYVQDTSDFSNNVVPQQEDAIVFAEIEPIKVNNEKEQEETTINETSTEQDNYKTLLSYTVDTVKYYDQIAEQVQSRDIKTLLDDVCRKMIENLILSGCKPIDDPQGEYDMTKHKVVPFQIVQEGTVYSNLIRPGVEYNGEVKLLAIIKLSEYEKQ